jgi:prepilin-type N-terminal cleavage/methylation domain-containing protein
LGDARFYAFYPATPYFGDRQMNAPKNMLHKDSQCRGFSFVEVMVAVTIIAIVALGTLNFQYQSVKQSRSAEAQTAAAHLGQLLLEDWKSTFGDPGYDATSLGLGFVAPVAPETGDYKITLNNQTFYLQKAEQLAPVSSGGSNPDPVAGITLEQLSVTVTWRKDGGTGAVSGTDPTLTFTTFVRRDS